MHRAKLSPRKELSKEKCQLHDELLIRFGAGVNHGWEALEAK